MHVGQGSGCNWGLCDVYLSCRRGQSIFIGWGVYELLKQNVLWLCFERDCIAAAWGYAIAVALVSNLQQLQMKLGRYCWFIDVQCGRDNLHRNQIVEWKMQCQLLFDKTRHCICWKQVGTTTYCSLECIVSMSGSGPFAVILLLLGWSNPSFAWQRGNYAMIRQRSHCKLNEWVHMA